MKSKHVELAGEVLWLFPEGAAYWERGSALFVADLHLGKEADFRRNGISVPAGPDDETLRCLELALTRSRARRLFILGDLWHSARASRATAGDRLSVWLAETEAQVEIVLGNHDRGAQDLNGAMVRPDGHEVGPFALRHHPPLECEKPCLCGHVHPVVRLQGKRMKCYWQTDQRMVLPSFGDFTGGFDVTVEPGLKHVLTGRQVLTLPPSVGRGRRFG